MNSLAVTMTQLRANFTSRSLNILCKCAVALIICVSSSSIYAQNHLRPGKEAKVADYLDYFDDQKGLLSIESLIAQPQHFESIGTKPFIANAKMHWYRLPLENTSNKEQSWVISTGVASAFTLNAYWVVNEAITQVRTKAELSRFASNTNFSISLAIPRHTKGQLFIQYNGLAHFPLDVRVLSSQEYMDRRFKFTLLNGIALGVIGVFALFFAIQALIFRRKEIAFYCLFILSIECLAIQVFGYGVRFIWPHKIFIDSHITQLCASVIYLFYFLFTAHLFQHGKRLYYGLCILAGITGVFCVLSFFWALDFFLTLIIAVGMPVAIFSAFLALPKQRMTALYFIIGSMVHYFFTCLLLIMLLGVPLGPMVFAMATLGQMVDIICFSVAILLNTKYLEKTLNWQVSERISDIREFNASETSAEQMRLINQNIILDSSSTAHDLQQALASIRLQLAMYPEAKNTLPLLHQTVHYAGEILDQKLTRGRTDFNKSAEPVDIELILKQAAARHKHGIPKLRIRTQPMTLRCSKLAVNRIVDNLLSNAHKYSKGKKILLSGRHKKHSYCIRVRDQGNGIPKDKLKRIFEPFKEVETMGMVDASHGLGLHIVKFLCEEFGFKFSIESEIGKGTCFTVCIDSTVA